MRTFIAIEVDQNIKDIIEQTQEQLKTLDCDIRWVKPHNVHLTLKFLGEVPSEKIDPIINILKDISAHTAPIETGLTCLGAFPNPQRPRILWVGLKDDDNEIKDLSKNIEKKLKKLKFKKENKPFRPHLTIGRLKSSRNVNELSKSIKNLPPFGNITQSIRHVTFFKSTLTAQGAIYESLAKIELAKSI